LKQALFVVLVKINLKFFFRQTFAAGSRAEDHQERQPVGKHSPGRRCAARRSQGSGEQVPQDPQRR